MSFIRGRDPPRRRTSHLETVEYEDGISKQIFHPASDRYIVTHHIPPLLPIRSMFNPPMHLHLYQSEEFLITSGSGYWYQPTHKDHSYHKKLITQHDGPFFLPAGTFHHFENASDTEPLVVKIRVEPSMDNDMKEGIFFRNFFGYLEDCRVAKTTPSLFQLELFLHTADGPLAIPIPGPDWLKWWVSRIFMLITGVVIGEWLLGYRRSYPEYYQPETSKQK